MSYHLIPVRMDIIKKTKVSNCWQGCGERRTLTQCGWERKLVQQLWKAIR
jgi:hypothetical protein